MKRHLLTRILTAVTLVLLACTALGEQPEKPPEGQGKYLIVLWHPGTPVPGKKEERMKNVPEPDVAKLGGRVLAAQANRRIVFLPYEVAKQLRKHQAVSYIQRIWTGEDFSEWNETAPAASRSERIASNSEQFTWAKDYTYDADGNITRIGSTASGYDEFAYDGVGRLTEAHVNGVPETYSYDAFGNLTGFGRQTGGRAIPVDPATNRLVGANYDAAGNITTREEQGRYVYDPLNMIVEYETVPGNVRRVLYDANDERIGMTDGSTLQRWTIRDFGGQIVREFRGDQLGLGMVWWWEQDHIRGEGQLIAGETQTWQYYSGEETQFTYGGRRHYHLDHLGSVRIVTNQAGKAIAENDFFPFGAARTRQYQEQLNEGDPHTDGMRFAGHWRDFMGHLNVEDDDYLDYMHARYYDPHLGRFLSVDPILGSARRPQSWNRYSYAMNRPITVIDPTGLRSVPTSGSQKPDWCQTVICEEFSYTDDPGGAGERTTHSFRDIGEFASWYFEYTARWRHFNQHPSVASARAIMDLPGAVEYGDISDEMAMAIEPGVTMLGMAAIPGDIPVGAVDDIVLVSRWGRPGLEAGDWVMKGGVNWWNYFWSGKWQPGFGNQFATYSSGQQYNVLRSTLKWPRGMGIDGWIKGLLRQRRYMP